MSGMRILFTAAVFVVAFVAGLAAHLWVDSRPYETGEEIHIA